MMQRHREGRVSPEQTYKSAASWRSDVAGENYWSSRNRLVGSYFALILMRRSHVDPGYAARTLASPSSEEAGVGGGLVGLHRLRERGNPSLAHQAVLWTLKERRDIDEHRSGSVGVGRCIVRHPCHGAAESTKLRQSHCRIRLRQVVEDRLRGHSSPWGRTRHRRHLVRRLSKGRHENDVLRGTLTIVDQCDERWV